MYRSCNTYGVCVNGLPAVGGSAGFNVRLCEDIVFLAATHTRVAHTSAPQPLTDVFQCWGWDYIQEFVFEELAAWLQSPVAGSAKQTVAPPLQPVGFSRSASNSRL